MNKYIMLEDAIEAIEVDNFYTYKNFENLPTIEIVKCEDCRYNGMGNCPMAWWDDSLQKLLNHCAADDFCSKGKSKDE